MLKKSTILDELNRVAQLLPIPIAWLDINSVILGVNEVGLKAIDTTRESYVGKSLYEIYPHAMAKHIKLHDERVIQTGKILGQEESVINILTGEIKYFYSLKAPLRDESGKIIGLVVSAVDISDRYHLEEELKAAKIIAEMAKAEAESANVLKTNFIQNMQHDIRTPASSVWSVLDNIVNNKISPDHELLVMLRNSAKQLWTICNDVIDFDRIEQGETPVLSKRLDIRQIINNIIDLNKTAAFNKKLELTYSVDEDIPLVLKGDEHRLGRILVNLMGNALKFTDKGFISLSVHLLEERKKDYIIQFKLQDTGIGIPLDKKDSLYEKFNRLNPASRNTYKGSGLGLRIVKIYVADLGGEINVKTELNKGTIFYLDIPFEKSLVNTIYEDKLANVDEINPISMPEATKRDDIIEPQSKATEPSKIHVLLIEDDMLARKIGKIILESIQCDVTTATDVKSALGVLSQAKFDLIFSDIGLPDGTGIDIINIIKKNRLSLNFITPFIAITANADTATIDKCEQVGFLEIMAKPMQASSVQAILAKYSINPNNSFYKNDEYRRPLGADLPPSEKELFQLADYSLFDVENAINVLGSESILYEVIKNIAASIPNDQDALEKAYAASDWQQVENLAHKMKGGAVYCGVTRMRYACQYLERYCKAGYSALQKNLFQQLLKVLEDTKLTLDEWLINNKREV
jgi:two-component system aerobic respiration control sensor histidine kinase ArcB